MTSEWCSSRWQDSGWQEVGLQVSSYTVGPMNIWAALGPATKHPAGPYEATSPAFPLDNVGEERDRQR